MAFQRVVVISNPAARRSRRRPGDVAALCAALNAAGVATEIRLTSAAGDATRLAVAAVAAGADLVVAHGGDGTVAEVLPAMVGSGRAMAVWPGGTANVLAHDLRMPLAPADMARRILAGAVRPTAAGLAEASDGSRRYFLAMAGVGLDAAINAAVPPGRKRRLGKAAFVLTAADQVLFSWQPRPFRLRWTGPGGSAGETTATFAVLGNTVSYGGGLRLTPTASLAADSLELCAFAAPSRASLLPILATAPFGWHRGRPGVTYVTVTTVEMEPVGTLPAPVQLDGEHTGVLPRRFRAVPGAVTLLL